MINFFSLNGILLYFFVSVSFLFVSTGERADVPKENCTSETVERILNSDTLSETERINLEQQLTHCLRALPSDSLRTEFISIYNQIWQRYEASELEKALVGVRIIHKINTDGLIYFPEKEDLFQQHLESSYATARSNYNTNPDLTLQLLGFTYSGFESIGRSKKVADCLYLQMYIQRQIGAYYESIPTAKKAFAIYNRLGSTSADNILIMLANSYYDLGIPDLAAQSTSLLLQNAARRIASTTKATLLNNLSTYQIDLKQFDSSLLNAKKALKLLISNDGPRTNVSSAKINLARSYFHLDEFDSAYLVYKAALDKNGDQRDMANITYHLAKWFESDLHEKHNYDSAIFYHHKSLTHLLGNFGESVFSNPPDSILQTPSSKVTRAMSFRAYSMLKRYPNDVEILKQAFAGYKIVAKQLTAIRKNLRNSEGSGLTLSSNYHNFFRSYLSCASILYRLTNDPKYAREALDIVENSRQKAFRNSRILHEVFSTNFLDQQLVNAFLNLSAEVLSVEFDFMNEIRTSKNAQSIALIEERLARLSTERNNLLRSNTKFVNLSDSLIQIVDSKAQDYITRFFNQNHKRPLIYYFWGEHNLFIVGTYKDKTHIDQIPVSSFENDLQEHVKYISTSPESPYPFSEVNNYDRRANKLYKLLIGNTLNQLGLSGLPNQLIINADGPLTNLPFQTLTTEISHKTSDFSELAYVVNQIEVSYLYSALQQPENFEKPKANVLGMSFSGEESDSKNFNSPDPDRQLRRSGKEQLPGTYLELKAIKEWFKGEFHSGKQAKKEVFKKSQAMNSFDILHLAVHGVNKSKSINGSRLTFSSDNESTDNQLTIPEIRNMQFDGQLAILSACESNLGSFEPGEGVYSISREFISSGCSSSISSLWAVNDQSTYLLMDTFYKKLSSGFEINSALTFAQRKMISNSKNDFFSHPFSWGGFIYHGRSLVTQKKENQWRYVIPALTLLFLVSFLLFQKRKEANIFAEH